MLTYRVQMTTRVEGSKRNWDKKQPSVRQNESGPPLGFATLSRLRQNAMATSNQIRRPRHESLQRTDMVVLVTAQPTDPEALWSWSALSISQGPAMIREEVETPRRAGDAGPPPRPATATQESHIPFFFAEPVVASFHWAARPARHPRESRLAPQVVAAPPTNRPGTLYVLPRLGTPACKT